MVISDGAAYDPPTGRVLDKYLRLNNPGGSQVFDAFYTVTHYAYNLSGGLTDLVYPSGKAVHLELDTENRPENASTEAMSPLVNSLTYTQHGALQDINTPDVLGGPLHYSRAYSPDTLRISGITLNRTTGPGRSSSDPLMGFSYFYFPDGNVRQISHPGFGGVDVETFVYDALDRLQRIDYGTLGSIEYGYDRYGNLLSRSVNMNAAYTTDTPFSYSASALAPRNRLPVGEGMPAEYDEAGNQTRITWMEGTTEETDILNYDAANRLKSCARLERAEGQQDDHWVADGEYIYDDGNGRLYSKSVFPWVDEYQHTIQDVKETVYVTDPAGETLSEVIHEFYDSGAKPEDATPPGVSEEARGNNAALDVCNPVPTGEEVHYQFTDHLGSTRYSVGGRWKFYHEIGSSQLSYCYQEELLEAAENLTPYGGFLTPNPPPSPLDFLAFDPITFTGKPRDMESGLDYSKARYYSSNLGRWPSVDPIIMTENHIANPSKWNLYAYTRDNPANFVDSDGNQEMQEENKSFLKFMWELFAGKDPSPMNDAQESATDSVVTENGENSSVVQNSQTRDWILGDVMPKYAEAADTACRWTDVTGVYHLHQGMVKGNTWDIISGLIGMATFGAGVKPASNIVFPNSKQLAKILEVTENVFHKEVKEEIL